MGGHGGLNILPQKRWNVYNFDNREKVRRDEEEAAKDEQLKQEQVRKRDAEFRLEQLRTARGLAPLNTEPESKPVHTNLFQGIKIFDPEEKEESKKRKRMKKEDVKVVSAEDDKYRLGYGVAGKGVKPPWYLQNRAEDVKPERKEEGGKRREGTNKKTVEVLREERLRREKTEKQRATTLLTQRERPSSSRSRR